MNTFLEIFLNEILGYSNIFTAPQVSSRNKIYSTIFTSSLCKLILIARCSKEKRTLTLNDFVEVINKIDKVLEFSFSLIKIWNLYLTLKF